MTEPVTSTPAAATPPAAAPPVSGENAHIGEGGTEAERFNAAVAKVKRDAAKADLAAMQEQIAQEDGVAETEADTADDAAETESDAAAAPAETSDEAASAPADIERAVGSIKTLLKTGDKAQAIDAIEQLLGKEALGALRLDSKQWASFRHQQKKSHAAIQAREAELQGIAGKVNETIESLRPLYEAREAFEAGDYDTAHQKAFGLDVNEFQKRALRQKAGEDPKVARLERELRERDRRESEERKLAESRANDAAREQAQTQYRTELGSKLESSADAHIASAAKIDGFVDQVMAIQDEHFDPMSRTTLPADTAAELAIERIRKIHEGWSTVFGLQTDQGGTPAQETDRAAPEKPAQAPKKRRALSQQESTEAAAAPRALTPQEIIEKHTRLMQRARAAELAAELG